MNPGQRDERVPVPRWSPSLLPPEGELHELRSNVQCAPLKSGFVVYVANLISEQLLPRRALDHGQVCVIVSACTQARWCLSRVVHAPASLHRVAAWRHSSPHC